MTKIYTEDDTFIRLKRVTFHQVMSEFQEWDRTNESALNRLEFMKVRGWTWLEFLTENAQRREAGLSHIY